MKLEKAIEIHEDHLHYWKDLEPLDYQDATKLLIGAGKQVLVERPHCWGLRHPILPGETED